MTNIDIKSLFEIRDQLFQDKTNEILSAMSPAIEGIADFLNLNVEVAQGDLSWQEVALYENIVMMVGVVSYEPGTTFTASNGEVMQVTEQTAGYFRRLLRIGLPLDLVLKGNKEEVVVFLKKSQAEADAADRELSQLFQEQDQSLSSNQAVTDFDLDALTDEQRLSLKLFGSGSKQ